MGCKAPFLFLFVIFIGYIFDISMRGCTALSCWFKAKYNFIFLFILNYNKGFNHAK